MELGLLLPSNQYAKIIVTKKSKGAIKIKANFRDLEEKHNEGMTLKATSLDFFTSCKAISLKDINQGSITLVHNSLYNA